MHCSRCGRFMRKSTHPGSDLYMCRWPCREIRSANPETNWGLMLLGFTLKAARP